MIRILVRILPALLLGAPLALIAQTPAALPHLSGTVRDGVGRTVAGAAVTLATPAGATAAAVRSGADGAFQVSLPSGTYTLTVAKPSFAAFAEVITVGAVNQPVPVTLDLAPMQQSLVVTATGVATPQTQLGQSVEVADRADLDARDALTADETLREMTGVQVYRNGAPGGLTNVMLRGGDPSFTKILLDGVPLQRFDFGAFDFSTLTPAALDSITVVRGADSVVYGTDAAAGVIDLRSRGGEGVGSPELTLNALGGGYGTAQQSAQLLGSWRPLSYAVTFAYLDTQNQLPNNKAWNQSWSGNFGLMLPRRAHLDLDLRHISSRAGDPNAFAFFDIADDSWQRQGETYASLSGRQQTTARWTNRFTFSQSALNYSYNTFAPSGTPFDPFGLGANYLGKTVTITGANGYSTTGQAILDYGGVYPQPFASDTLGRYATVETDFAFAPGWNLVAGYRYGDELGVTSPLTHWHDNGVFTEVSGALWDRVFGSAGASEDSHSRFGNTFNPQASLALVPRLSRAGWWDEIRLHANAGTAQKDPTITQDQSSLYQDVITADGAAAAAQLHLGAVRPQRAHTFDAGVDQYLFGDQVRLGATWFDDRYDDLIEFVPAYGFAQLGVSTAAANAAQAAGGAYLNSLSEKNQGLELDLQARRRGGWHGGASYTYMVPVVTSSFSSDALSPSYNPAFPTIAIGAYSPLVGGRPFHVAPESGAVVLGYDRGRWQLQTNAYLSSRRDDSTFLSDGYFGASMLLPNHDLAPAYAELNLSGSYRWNARLTWEAVVENLANQNYQEAFGYPSLGRTFRVGARLTLTRPNEP